MAITYLPAKDIIMRVKPCAWRYTVQSGFPNDKNHYGVIAQEILQEFGPEYNFVDTSDTWFRVNYYEFIGPMIKCIQDQQHQLDDQEQRIVQLETIINNLTHNK